MNNKILHQTKKKKMEHLAHNSNNRKSKYANEGTHEDDNVSC